MFSWISSLSLSSFTSNNAIIAFSLFVLFSLLTTIAVTLFILALPVQFPLNQKTEPSRHAHPVIYWSKKILKNIFGILFIIIGVIMFVTPGQGLLTLLIGIMLVDFPGKYKLETKIITQPKVLSLINQVRIRFKKLPLEIVNRNITTPS